VVEKVNYMVDFSKVVFAFGDEEIRDLVDRLDNRCFHKELQKDFMDVFAESSITSPKIKRVSCKLDYKCFSDYVFIIFIFNYPYSVWVMVGDSKKISHPSSSSVFIFKSSSESSSSIRTSFARSWKKRILERNLYERKKEKYKMTNMVVYNLNDLEYLTV
jgi:hypothetical protein